MAGSLLWSPAMVCEAPLWGPAMVCEGPFCVNSPVTSIRGPFPLSDGQNTYLGFR